MPDGMCPLVVLDVLELARCAEQAAVASFFPFTASAGSMESFACCSLTLPAPVAPTVTL